MTADNLDNLTRRAHMVGASVETVLHHTDKAIVATGRHRGNSVVIKLLTTADPYWRLRRSHEVDVYRLFEVESPPARTARLIHDDGDGMMLLTMVPGVRLHNARHIDADLDAATVAAVLGALNAVATWRPATPPPAMIADYQGRIDAERAAGIIDDPAHERVSDLLVRSGPGRNVQHGDPLPANLLVHRQGCGLVDWEHYGLYLPVLRGWRLMLSPA
jgi:aminoglycoside phosphotransferase (APT) family kinase protein